MLEVDRYENRVRRYLREAKVTQAQLKASLAHPMQASDVSNIVRGTAHGKPLLPLPETAQDFANTLSTFVGKPLSVAQVFPGLKKRWAERCCIRGGRRPRGGA